MFNLFKREKKSSVQRISPKQAKEMLEATDTILIDVRTAQEFKQRRIKGSKNIPLDSLLALAPKAIEDKKKPLLVYCLSGGRSAQASSLLSRMGYENIYDLGGINNWPYETTQG